MPLPSGFSEFEHLQGVYRKTINQIVREEFSDQSWVDTNPDITTSRGSLRWACTHKDDDSAAMTQMRTDLFYMILRKASDLHPPMYTIPVDSYHESVKFKPQVTLFFREDQEDVEDSFTQVRSEISFRLMNESADTLTRSEATQLGNKIKQLFGANNGFRWKRGRLKVSYRDVSKGYQFILTIWDEAEAKRVIEQVLDIRGDTPDWGNLSISKSERVFSTVPQTKVVLGRTTRLRRDRPIATVRFRWAELKMWELANPVILCDLTGYWRNALVTA